MKKAKTTTPSTLSAAETPVVQEILRAAGENATSEAICAAAGARYSEGGTDYSEVATGTYFAAVQAGFDGHQGDWMRAIQAAVAGRGCAHSKCAEASNAREDARRAELSPEALAAEDARTRARGAALLAPGKPVAAALEPAPAVPSLEDIGEWLR